MSTELQSHDSTRKLRLLIIAGGCTGEHEISMLSGRTIYEFLSNMSKFHVRIVVITREGRWLSESDSHKALMAGNAPHGGEPTLPGPPLAERCDVVWSFVDDWNGCGGVIQGYLETCGVAYMGCGPLATALCRDKVMAKEILKSHGIPMVRHVAFTSENYIENPTAIVQRIKRMNVPWFVKPSNLGSTVGISKVQHEASLGRAIEEAMRYDRRIIVEEGLDNPREIEVAIIGNHNPYVSPVGEAMHISEIMDFKTKYSGGNQLHTPADIPSEIAKRVQTMGLHAYQLLDCAGYARVDFFLDQRTDEVYFNEISASPGFTPFSVFQKLMAGGGYNLLELVETLVKFALERHGHRNKNMVMMYGDRPHL